MKTTTTSATALASAANVHRADPGLDEAFRQISIADNPAAAGAT